MDLIKTVILLAVAMLILIASAHAEHAHQIPEEHTVIGAHDAATGIVTFEAWYNNRNKLDRTDGPAIIYRDAKTGAVTREEWWRNGRQIKRNQAPARRRKVI